VVIIVVVDIVNDFKAKINSNMMITLFFPETKVKLLGTHWFCRDGTQQYTYLKFLKLLMEIICKSLKSAKGHTTFATWRMNKGQSKGHINENVEKNP
jgi:hypothetical protein